MVLGGNSVSIISHIKVKMCWNAEVSRNTFLIGVVGIIIGISYGMSLPVAFFCLSVSLMQLVEYFVWTYYDNKTVNYYASVAASNLLWIQPIASILTLTNSTYRNIALIVNTGLSGIGYFIESEKDYSMTRANNGHLSWNWMSTYNPITIVSLVVYMIFLFSPIIINKQYDLAALAGGTLVLSLYTYFRENTWGSMWCWIVNGLVLLTIGKTILH